MFLSFTFWINCPRDLRYFANSRPSTSNFKSFSRRLEQFFLTVSQNKFGKKIPILWLTMGWIYIGSSIPIFQSMSCTHNPHLDLYYFLSMWKQVQKSSNARSKRVSKQCVNFLLLFLGFYAVEVRYLSSLKAWYDTFGLWLQKLLS